MPLKRIFYHKNEKSRTYLNKKALLSVIFTYSKLEKFMSTLNFNKLSSFSEKLSSQIIEKAFTNTQVLNGAAILSASTLEQVNLMTIFGLFNEWQENMERMKSPYFNLENPSVKTALQQYMNVLSNNIALQKVDAQSLFTKACLESNLLVLEPNAFFKRYLNAQHKENLEKSDITFLQKYIKKQPHLVKKIIVLLENKEIVSKAEIEQISSELLAQNKLDNVEDWLAEVSKLSAISKGDLFDSEIAIETKDSFAPSFFDDFQRPAQQEKIFEAEILPVSVPVENTIATKPLIKPSETTLNDTFSDKTQSLNEVISTKSDEKTLIEKHSKASFGNIFDVISLNQKFLFVNKLFAGDTKAFEDTLTTLQLIESKAELENQLNYKYAPKYQWSLNQEVADELIELLNRKFA